MKCSPTRPHRDGTGKRALPITARHIPGLVFRCPWFPVTIPGPCSWRSCARWITAPGLRRLPLEPGGSRRTTASRKRTAMWTAIPLVIAVDMDLRRLERVCRDACNRDGVKSLWPPGGPDVRPALGQFPRRAPVRARVSIPRCLRRLSEKTFPQAIPGRMSRFAGKAG